MTQFSHLSHRLAFRSLHLAAVVLSEASAMIVGGGLHCHRILGCLSIYVEWVWIDIHTSPVEHCSYRRRTLYTLSPVDSPLGYRPSSQRD